MARKFLTPIDLSKLELQNARIQNLASAPASPVTGQIYYDTSINTLYFWNGSAWVNSASSVAYGLLSARPAASASNNNTLYYATDNSILYVSNGTSWSQVSAFGSGVSTAIVIGTTSSTDGTSTSYARADHTHAGPGFGSPSTLSFGGSAVNGSATTVSRSDHEHAMPAHDAAAHSAIKISDLAAPSADVSFGTYKITSLADPTSAQHAATKNYVDGRKVTDLTAPTSSFSMNNQRITDVATPSNPNDVATKEYVDAVAEGLHIHASCDAATTGTLASITGGTVTYNNGTNGLNATLTLSVALTTLDGYSLQNGDRILVKDQATTAHNGIYTWGPGGTVLTRATDFNTGAEIAGGDFTFVTNGSQYNNTGWVQTEGVVNVGTDAVVFQQFSGTGTYTATNGVLLTGTNFTFNPDSTGGLQTGAIGASIKLQTNSGLSTTSNGLAVGAGSGISVGTNTVSVNLAAASGLNTTSGLAVGAGTGITVSTNTIAIDTSVVARKYSVSLSGSSTSYTVTHNLGTRDVTVLVRETNSPYAKVEPDIEMATTNTITVSFATAPSSNQYTVTVIG